MSLPPKPDYDLRPGTVASLTARLVIVAVMCGFQYWLFTAALEAAGAGHSRILWPAFLSSLLCFVLVVGLIGAGEAGQRRGPSRPE